MAQLTFGSESSGDKEHRTETIGDADRRFATEPCERECCDDSRGDRDQVQRRKVDVFIPGDGSRVDDCPAEHERRAEEARRH